MKKLLILIWLIILSGIGFIVYQIYYEPNNQQNPNNQEENNGVERGNSSENNNQNNNSSNSTPTISEDKLDFNQYIEKGDQYFHQQDYKTAIKYYLRAKEENSDSTIPVIKLGDSYLLSHQPQDALSQYQKVFNSNPNLPEITLKLAKAHIHNGNIQQAKDLIWKLLESENQNSEALYYQALIFIFANEYSNAENNFKQIIASTQSTQELKDKSQIYIESYKLFSYYNEGDPIYLKTLLAKSMADSREFQMAIHTLKDIIKAKTNYADAWVILGYSYLKTNQITNSIDTLLQARTLQPNNANIHFYLGMAYYLKNDLSNAASSFQMAKTNNYSPIDEIDFTLAEIQFKQNNFTAASQSYEKLLSKNNNHIEIYDRLITIYLDHIPNPERLAVLTQEMHEKYPNDAITFTILGNITFLNKNNKAAENSYLKAIELNPNIDIAHLNLGKIYEEKGSITLAKNHYKTAYSISNSNKIKTEAGQLYNNLNNQ